MNAFWAVDHNISLEKRTFLGEVTSLLYVDRNLLLAAIGPILSVFSIQEGETLCMLQAYEGCLIHGIRLIEDNNNNNGLVRVLLFGEKTIKIVDYVCQHRSLSVIQTFDEFSDWIWDVIYIPSDLSKRIASSESADGNVLAIGFAHNSVELWNWKTKECLKTVYCTDRSILYSMALLVSPDNNLLIAAGTVLTDILLWNFEKGGSIDTVISGNTGVPLRLRWSKDRKHLSSTADDRSVRLWRNVVNHLDTGNNNSHTINTADAILFGHQARVWDCCVLEEYIISVGEDSKARIWDHSGKCLGVLSGHQGKNIRALAVSDDDDLIITGSSDSSIRLWSLNEALEKSTGSLNYILSLPQSSNIQNKKENDSPRSLYLANQNTLIVATQKGDIHKIDVLTGVWQLIHSTSANRRCHTLSYSENDILLIGDINGGITAVDLNTTPHQESHIQAHSKTVSQLFLCQTPFSIGSVPHSTLSFVSSSLDEQLIFWNLQQTLDVFKLVQIGSIHLASLYNNNNNNKKDSLSATSFIVVYHLNLIFCGDSLGGIHVFTFEETEQAFSVRHHCSYLNAHSGKNRVSDLIFLEKTNTLISGGRDGNVCQFQLETSDETHQYSLQRTIVMKSSIEVINSLFYRDQQLYVMGFFGPDMILQNHTTKNNILQINCGGHKRSFDFRLVGEQQNFTFVFLQNQKIHISMSNHSKQQFNKSILYSQYHGWQTHDIIFLEEFDEKGNFYLVSASEDTTGKLLKYSISEDHFDTIDCLQDLSGHVSGVRTISTSSFAGRNSLLFTGGSFAEIKCWRILKSAIANQDIILQPVPLNMKQNGGSQARIMGLEAFPIGMINDEYMHGIATVRSDCLVELFTYCENSQKISLVARAKYHNCAILSLAYIEYNDRRLIASGGTDGNIIITDITDAFRIEGGEQNLFHLQPSLTINAHQVGVNCLQFMIKEEHLELVSAGDDQALALHLFEKSDDTLFIKHNSSSHVKIAHNAQITAMAALNSLVFTSGPDQRLHVWKTSSGKLNLVATCTLEVSDIESLDVQRSSDGHYLVAVTGAGMQSIKFRGL